MFGDSNKAVSAYGAVDLYPDSIFRVAPKGFDIQMLLDPFEKQLNLPALFIKHCNIFCADIKRIGDVCKRAFELLGIIHNSAKFPGVFLLGLIAGKFNDLVTDDTVIVFNKRLSVKDFVLKSASLTDNEIRVNDVDFVQSAKVKVAPVKDVVSIGLIRDLIHRLGVMNVGVGDMNIGRNLGNHIEERMSFDSAFSTAELCPPEKVEAEINRCRVKRIKLSVEFKRCINSFILRYVNEFLSKLFKYVVIPVRIGFGKVRQFNLFFPESQMVSFSGVCSHYTDEFSKSITTVQLTKHHDKQLIPTGKVFDVLVSFIIFDDPIKSFLRKQFDKLCKYISSSIHIALRLKLKQYMKSNVDVKLLAVSC